MPIQYLDSNSLDVDSTTEAIAWLPRGEIVNYNSYIQDIALNIHVESKNHRSKQGLQPPRPQGALPLAMLFVVPVGAGLRPARILCASLMASWGVKAAAAALMEPENGSEIRLHNLTAQVLKNTALSKSIRRRSLRDPAALAGTGHGCKWDKRLAIEGSHITVVLLGDKREDRITEKKTTTCFLPSRISRKAKPVQGEGPNQGLGGNDFEGVNGLQDRRALRTHDRGGRRAGLPSLRDLLLLLASLW